jgi:hypothetical protein
MLDALVVGRFEVFSPANQQNSNAVESSNFAIPAFLNQCD